MDWVAWVMGCRGVAFSLFAEGLIQHGQHGKTGIGGGGEGKGGREGGGVSLFGFF